MHHDDNSVADLALCAMLAFWTQDPTQMDRLFRQSGLMRPKWDETHGAQTYGERTIVEALARHTEHYTPYHGAQLVLPSTMQHAQQSQNSTTAGTDAAQDDAPPWLLPFSDTYNARAMVRDHGQDLRYCWPWHKWLVWTGAHWQGDDHGAVRRKAKQTIKRLARYAEALDDVTAKALMAHIKKSLSTAAIKAMIEGAQDEPGIPVLPEALDADPWLLNCTNGTLDLQTGTLRPHERADLLTRCIPVAYEAAALCPTWDAFLDRIMAGNQRLIRFLQRAVGYALTGVIREHVLLILWGTGRNGKSTFLNTLRALLGPYGLQAPSELLLVSHNDRHPTERADLFGKRFVAAIETEQGRKLAEVFVKEATGGDPIRARRMREDFWEFQPTHKVFLATNHKPVITGTDTAIWERIRLIPFTVTIPKDERDTTLPDKLHAELPGILAWAVRGCLAWQQDGLGEPDEVQQATAGYRTEMDVLGQFISECCLVGPHYRTKADKLYDAYKLRQGHPPGSLRLGDGPDGARL
jgi:putative DNA primase/helicase